MNLFRNWTTGDFEREADEFCKLAFYNYGLELDYTPNTFRELESILVENFAPGSADEHPALIVSMGCYVGEVIARTFGGQWRANEEFFQSPAVVIEGKLQTRTFPLSRVWRRFEYGSEQSLVEYLGEVRRTLADL
jgi:hypothetical protein